MKNNKNNTTTSETSSPIVRTYPYSPMPGVVVYEELKFKSSAAELRKAATWDKRLRQTRAFLKTLAAPGWVLRPITKGGYQLVADL